jgi:hypothetical protein
MTKKVKVELTPVEILDISCWLTMLQFEREKHPECFTKGQVDNIKNMSNKLLKEYNKTKIN